MPFNPNIDPIADRCFVAPAESDFDPINPDYYVRNGVSVDDVIEWWGLNFRLGSAISYILRAGKKSKETHIQDLEKAKAFLQREIGRLRERG